MENAKSKIIVIMGPTASGKSDVAIGLAQKFNGEIISADSRQIYRNMDIGTGKIHGEWSMEHGAFISEDIPHYLIDIVQPMEEYNISHFQKDATRAINDVLGRGKIPIICGGTNFWISAIINETVLPEVKPNPKLRQKLEKFTETELFAQLQKKDPHRAQSIDKHNKVRLIRALEIIEEIGKVPTLSSDFSNHSSKHEFLQIAISVSREELNEKIKRRLQLRLESGMIEEVKSLYAKKVTWEWMEKIGLEYRWISRYLQKKISLEEMKEKLTFDIIHYAKRQMTWLKKNKAIKWKKNYKEIEGEVSNFLLK